MKSDRFRLTPKSKCAIMALDFFIFTLIVALVFRLRLGSQFTDVLQAPAFWTISFFLLSNLYIFGNYDLDRDNSFVPVIYRNGVSIVVALVGTILLNYLLSSDRAGLFGRGILLGSLFIYYFASLTVRFLLWRYLRDIRSAVKILIITENKHREFLEAELKKNKFSGHWSWMIRDRVGPESEVYSWDEIAQVLGQSWSAWVIAGPLELIEKDLGADLLDARFKGVRIIDLSRFYEHTWRKIPVFHLGASWFFLSEGFSLLANRFRLRLKRLTDVILSAILLMITWPLMVITALMIRFESSGPVIYRQIRTGKDGGPFTIFKFRSMRNDAEKSGVQWAQTNDTRITRVGKLIRLTRLDELPQLWNVLKGDMSFIGPRPERPEFNVELAEKIPYYDLRHMVRPGLTGWAQVSYPYGASVEDAREKLQYDLFYIKNFTFVLDLQIVLKTISVVILGKGR
jgi:sugar transferase (PEP-CTERM system associated)